MNFYGPISGPQHTLFGRVPPIMEAMRLAMLRAAQMAVPPAMFSAALPQWCHNIADELTCTVFRGVVNCAPQGRRQICRKAGQIVGLMIRLLIFHFREISVVLEREGLSKLTPEQNRRLDALTGWEVGCELASKLAARPIRTRRQLLKFYNARLKQWGVRTIKAGWNLTTFALKQSVGDVLEFLTGIPEGFKCFLKTDGNFSKPGKRREIFFLLLIFWPEIEEMRQEQPPLTRKFLLDWLEKQEGKQLVESDKSFFELCDDISLDLAPRGHPSKLLPV